jgi:hypothetical protein
MGCSAPCNSILYVRSFFKNGIDLTVFVILQVIYACLLVNGVFINLLLNHGIRGLHGIFFFASAQVASAGCMCSMIVYFLHCICVCDCDGRHESLIMLSHSVMVRRSHLLARCYPCTMCMCTTKIKTLEIARVSWTLHLPYFLVEKPVLKPAIKRQTNIDGI